MGERGYTCRSREAGLAEVYRALVKATTRLPEQTQQVIVAVYGLDGQPARTLAEVGREWGLSGEGVRYWRNKQLKSRPRKLSAKYRI